MDGHGHNTLFTTMQNKAKQRQESKKKTYNLFLEKHIRNTRYHTCYYFKSPNYIIKSVNSLLGKTGTFKAQTSTDKITQQFM